MSYDLIFWKYKKDVYLDNQDTYEKCSDGQYVEGLETLPIEAIIKDIQQEFIDWKLEGSKLDFENPSRKGAFETYYTNQFLSFNCHGMLGQDMNRIIDVMLSYDCPLYDPQVPQRYDGN